MRSEPARRVLLPLIPWADESLLGFIARTAEHNCLQSPFEITRHAGQLYAYRTVAATSDAIDCQQLAYTLGISLKEVLKRRREVVSKSQAPDGEGAPPREWFETSRRRFSPASLRQSPYSRDAWECRLLPFCVESWEILLDRCTSCLRAMTWRRAAILSCEHCGADLRTQTASKVPIEYRQNLLDLAQLVKGVASKNSLFSPLPFHIVGAILLQFMRLRTPGNRQVKVARLACDVDTIKKISTAVDLLENWPTGFFNMARLATITPSEQVPALPNFNRVLSGLVDFPDPRGRQFLRSGLRRFLADQPGAHDNIGTREASRISRLGSAELLSSRQAGKLRTVFIIDLDGRLRRNFDRSEIVEARDLLDHLISIEGAASRLGLTYHGIEQLICFGLLSPIEHPFFSRTSEHLFDRRCINKLVERIGKNALAEEIIARPVLLAELRRTTRARVFPYGSLFVELLNRTIPFAVRPEGKTFAARLCFAEADRHRIDRLAFARTNFPQFAFAGAMNMLDAADALHLRPNKAKFLSDYQQRSGGRHHRTLAVDLVERFARQSLSSIELKARLGPHIKAFMRYCRREEMPKSEAFGWERAPIEALIDAYLSSIEPVRITDDPQPVLLACDRPSKP